MDFEVLASNLGIDQEDFMELVELFIDTTQADIAKIKAGMAKDDAIEAAAAAHSIKGAAGNLGFVEMSELAKKMEFQAKKGSLEGFAQDLEQLQFHLDSLNA